ncbi:glycosyltransferase [Sphingomonas sp. CFBP 13603]|uniref:glycosyltransferase n=1 Tax=Sphingomonas sp. CFBP 13603 TaxID=2774040 RepID=UPI001865E742|nr:glycosyltransferase [Sphingomonas sp. CFBP 13603]MBE2992948.1 glycosyltransferase [Sphingomonas sp. CFBP 13603]
MKICVVTPRWAIAGVPLAQRRLALALAAEGHDVDLVIGRKDSDLTIPDTPGVTVVIWNAAGVRHMVLPLVRYLKTTKPAVVFSAEDHLNGAVLLAALLARSNAKITGSSRVPPSDSYSNTPFTKGWFRKIAMTIISRRADALTCVSQDMVTAYREYFPGGPHEAVYNIIDDATSRARAAEPVEHTWFVKRDVPLVVSAGTLTGRKNFKMLVNVLGELKRRGRYVRLAIFGEGYRREELETLIAHHGIEDRTWLPGRVANPLAYFSHADVLALTSYAEGLPNVLVEGMISGCTPVATDCPTGPREVIEGGRVGHLVAIDDVIAMADAIERALEFPASSAALDRATAPFRERVILAQHFALLGLELEPEENRDQERSALV